MKPKQQKTKLQEPKYAHPQIEKFMKFLKEERDDAVSGAMGSGSAWNHGISEEAKHIFKKAKKIFEVKKVKKKIKSKKKSDWVPSMLDGEEDGYNADWKQ
jgi:mannitol/fructose-specific phosphotransferase system IIA component